MASIARSIAGCFRFLTLIQSGERLIGTNLDGNMVEVRGCDFYTFRLGFRIKEMLEAKANDGGRKER
jgi:hypothetical protein